MICAELNLNFSEVRGAIMTASPMHYVAEARDGVGGHCLPMAIEWLGQFGNPKIAHAAVQMDILYRQFLNLGA